MMPAWTVFVLVPALVILSFPILVAWMFHRGRRGSRTPLEASRISVIVPISGDEAGLEERAVEWLDQRAACPLEFVFCTTRDDDPALPAVKRAMAARPGRDARVVVTGGPAGLGKMHNLIAGVAAARGDVFVFLDSDVRLPDRSYVERFTAHLGRPGAGLVSCFPACRGGIGVSSTLLAMTINNDLLGCFALAALSGRFVVANGACLAIRRGTLEATGGLEPLRRQLLMDTALARRVAATGRRVVLHDEAVGVETHRVTWNDMWWQCVRWQASMWRVLPRWRTIAFLWMRSATALALIAAVATGFSFAAVCLAGIVLLARFVSAWTLDARYIRNPGFGRGVWLLPAVEILNVVSGAVAMFTTKVTWRGRRYRIARGGIVSGPVANEPAYPRTTEVEEAARA